VAEPAVVVENLSKRFGETVAVNDVSFSVASGELMCLLGPSGCGKTTLLRMLAGLLEPTSGEIYLGGRCVYSAKKGIFVPPAKRGIGMMFQNYALWPHMKVVDNITYGLKTLKLERGESQRRLAETAGMMGIEAFLERFPSELSGGQQQRVALARMVVVQPDIFLMDEPLSNLDARLRVHTRVELRRIQQSFRTSGVYVTHDQEEALALADTIAVMHDGVILHLGTPEDVYEDSRHIFVAGFLGSPPPNQLASRVEGVDGVSQVQVPGFGAVRLDRRVDEREVMISLRPEYCQVVGTHGAGGARANGDGARLHGSFRLVSAQFMGAHYVLLIEGEGSGPLIVRYDKARETMAEGGLVAVEVDVDALRFYDRASGRLLAKGPRVVDEWEPAEVR
jgi:ABC-type sugar transport system ATPase subunit